MRLLADPGEIGGSCNLGCCGVMISVICGRGAGVRGDDSDSELVCKTACSVRTGDEFGDAVVELVFSFGSDGI